MQELRPMRLAAPDGGWGWVILVSAIGINFLIPGTIKSFGVLYVEFIRVFEATPSQASWIPGLCYFLYSSLGECRLISFDIRVYFDIVIVNDGKFFSGPLTSILSMKYSYRIVAMTGGAFAATGLMISYFANSVTYLYFRYDTA